MPQPIIDPEKVSEWAASMRAVFGSGPGDVGTWLAVGLTIAFALVVVLAAVRAAKQRQPDAMDELQKLVEAAPGPKAFKRPPLHTR